MRAQEFILETAEESQILNIVADRAADTILKIIADKKAKLGASIHDTTFTPKTRLTVFGVKLSDLNMPQTTSLAVKEMINRVDLRVDSETPNPDMLNTASYAPADATDNEPRIIVRYPAIAMLAKRDGRDVGDVLRDSLVHEMQHALDDIKSKGTALKSTQHKSVANVTTDQDFETYLKLPYEINARFATAARWVANDIINGAVTRANLGQSVKLAFANNDLVDIFKDRPRAYNRLLTRMFKFFEAELAQPKKVEPGSLFAKLKSWLTSRSHEVIK